MSTLTRATARKTPGVPAARLAQIAAGIRNGAVVLFPTETVYGLGTSAFSLPGIRRIYRLKGRRWNKPLQLLVPSLEAAAPLVEAIPPEALRAAKKFCPGPLTLVLRASSLGRLVTGGLETIGLRVPDHPVARALLQAAGVPLAATSANHSAEKPVTSHANAQKLFGRQVDWVLEGACELRQASSVVDFSHFPFTVKREGAITKKRLEALLG